MKRADLVLWANVLMGGLLTVQLALIALSAPKWWAAAGPALGGYLAFMLSVFLNSDKNPLQNLAQGAKAALRASFALNLAMLGVLTALNAGAWLWRGYKANAPQGVYRLVVRHGSAQVTGLTVVFKVLDPITRKTQREIATDIDGMARFPARIGDLLMIRVQDTEGRFATVEPGVALTAELLDQAHPFDIAKVRDEDWTEAQGVPTGFKTVAALANRGGENKVYGARDVLARLAPLGRLPDVDMVVAHEAYAIGYDTRIRQARWVAYEVRERAEDVRRKSNFTVDPLLPRSLQATNADYVGSGYDRGGLVRSMDVATTQDNMDSARHYTATAPQRPALNRRLWAWIEDYSADQRAPDGSNRVFVIRGPAYLASAAPARGKFLTIGVNHIPVPTHFFEILAVQKPGAPLTLECFLAPNVDQVWAKGAGTIDAFRVSRTRIQEATGLKFFSDRPVSENACR